MSKDEISNPGGTKNSDLKSTLIQIHVSLHDRAVRAVNNALVVRNWLFGKYLVEHEQSFNQRAPYGQETLKKLAQELDLKGCSARSLAAYRKFYLCYQNILQALPAKFDSLSKQQIPYEELIAKLPLSWTHYVSLLGIQSQEERTFYEIETLQNQWGTRELDRQIQSALYERLALSKDQNAVIALSQEGQRVESPLDLIKDPYILEFTGLEERASYSEGDLEAALISQIEAFLLELGKGFLFESRQKRFTFDNRHFYVDLVFYNRLLKCYVIIDLKIGDLTHQDLGQIQMYVNYFDRHVKTEEEHPTIGILLCHTKSDELVELTLPTEANIFASEYKLYLPSKNEFKRQLQQARQNWEHNLPPNC